MFARRTGLTVAGLGLLTAGLVACQGDQQQQQQKEPGQPIDFNAGGFEGLESGQLALLAATCTPTADPVVITVASGEFAYLYKRASDGAVVVNANASGGGQCTFSSTKKITITTNDTGTQNHKVLIDYLSGQFSPGDTNGVGITIDLKTTGVNQVMFRGTTNPDVFTLATKTGVSYVGFATGSATPVTAPAFANVSLANVSDVTITAGPGDDVIDGQGTDMTSPTPLVALDGNISLTVHGGDGNDQITSGAASVDPAQNSLNGNGGNDIFHQPSALASDVISGGSDPTITRTLTGITTGTDTTTVVATGTTTAVTTGSTAGTDTMTSTQTASTTKSITATGTMSLTATIAKATTASATGTVSGTQTATGTTSWTGTFVGTGTAVGTSKTFTGTATGTITVSSTLTLTATGTVTGTMNPSGTKTATGVGIASNTKSDTQTYTAAVISVTKTSVQTDTSVDVVDYSGRSASINVTLGDEAVAASASAKIVLPNSRALRSYDSFEVVDGTLTDSEDPDSSTSRVVEFHRTGSYAVGDIATPSNGAADLAVDETIVVDDGAHPVTFNFAITVGTGTLTNTGTSTATNTNAVITVNVDDDRATVAQKIADGIRHYQTATWTGTASGTATMTSTSIVPNVTVLDPDSGNSDVVSLQSRNAVAGSPFVAATAANLTATDGTAAVLWNANGSSTIAVEFDDASANVLAAALATSVASTITSDASLAVTAAASGTILTLTASGGAAVKPAFAVTVKSGGFDITLVSNGTPASGPGANDGTSGEKDSILSDIEVVIGGSGADVIDATHSTTIVHTLFGMSGDDTLILGAGAVAGNVLYGGPGDDHLLGGGAVDTLFGGDGNDFVAGGLGNDNIDGDGANCVVASGTVYASSLCTTGYAAASTTAGSNYLDYSDRTALVTVDLGNLAGATTVGVSGEKDIVTNCTNVRGGSGADSLTGSTADNIILGGPGDDTIIGGAGNDSLYGDNGDDTISGGAGDDYIYGGSGVNTLFGDASGYTGTAGINMLDNSQGRNGAIDCGAGDMDILFSNGEETGVTTCELR
jgi:hypothetical protein